MIAAWCKGQKQMAVQQSMASVGGKLFFCPNKLLEYKENSCDKEEYIYLRLCREGTDGESSCV